MREDLTRRNFVAILAGVASASAATTTGCIGGDEPLPEPVALDAGQACDVCGMIIRDHPGPVGQTYYRDNAPEGRAEDEPAWFCSNDCLFDFYFQRRGRGWEPLVQYTTDYSAVDYEVTEESGSLFLTSHLGAGDFARGEETTLVVDSDVLGAMGPSLVPFTDEQDATGFQNEYGGDRLAFGDVSQQLLDSL
jgi:copper chaperone NosL